MSYFCFLKIWQQQKMAYGMVENSKTANGVEKGHNGLVIMKKFASKALLLVLAACAIVGCGRRDLQQVEQIMECDVETADSLIYSMNEPTGYAPAYSAQADLTSLPAGEYVVEIYAFDEWWTGYFEIE